MENEDYSGQSLQELCSEYRDLHKEAEEYKKLSEAANKRKASVEAKIIALMDASGLESTRITGVGTFAPKVETSYRMVDKNSVLAAIRERDEQTFDGLITINANTFKSFMKDVSNSDNESDLEFFTDMVEKGLIHISTFKKLSMRKA